MYKFVFEDSCADHEAQLYTVRDYSGYFCIASGIPLKTSNPGLTKDLCAKLRAKHQFLRSGQDEALHAAQKVLYEAIAQRKEHYKRKIECKISANNAHAGWQGLKAVTGYSKYKTTAPQGDDTTWAEKLNQFYAVTNML